MKPRKWGEIVIEAAEFNDFLTLLKQVGSYSMIRQVGSPGECGEQHSNEFVFEVENFHFIVACDMASASTLQEYQAG